jgi:hypothetical protein
MRPLLIPCDGCERLLTINHLKRIFENPFPDLRSIEASYPYPPNEIVFLSELNSLIFPMQKRKYQSEILPQMSRDEEIFANKLL